mmetsp:Transcript_12868/g.19940  ORF Transcript_12868/g.19940 Transcript_12868/m.19940 type:complete len:954 (+) Transcript_12868:123-2984(+)
MNVEEETCGNDENQIDPITPSPLRRRATSMKVSSSGREFYCHGQAIDQIIDEYANADKDSSKTWTRMFVERFLIDKSWYFPGKDKTNGPQLSKAYAYYEHFALARYLSHDVSATADHKFIRAAPGESSVPTELYSPFFTRESTLGEFGIGVGLYFTMLRLLSIVLVLAGLINIPNILYYSSTEYSDQDAIDVFAKGSAICTLEEWTVCTDCSTEGLVIGSEQAKRYAESSDTIFALRNLCPRPELTQAMVHFSSLITLLVIFWLLGLYEKQREVIFDEGKQTAQDYSVLVKNPPPGAYDPEKWRVFFSQFTEKQVTSVSVLLNNHKLVRKLIYRRVLRKKLEEYIPRDLDLDEEDLVREQVSMFLKDQEGEKRGFFSLLCACTFIPILRCFGYFLPPDVLVDRFYHLKEEIKDLLKEKYDVVKVFVTFETEGGQRNALDALKASKVVTMFNLTDQMPPSTIFEGRVLHVDEPPEPDTVRYLDLHVGIITRYVKYFTTLLLTIGIVIGCGFLVQLTRRDLGSEYSAYLTTAFNSIIPLIVKLLLQLENHPDESKLQQSLYLKVTFFRWVNTALLTMWLTPFTSTISAGKRDIILTIKNILVAELWFSPSLRLLDLFGNLKKHYFGPRAVTQNSMNLWFQGTPYNLGERYTDLTKILFVVFVYSVWFPSGFFFGAAILLVQYYTDKYCLTRIWSQAPLLGPNLAKFSRRYFFTTALLLFGIIASYAFAQFPYDQVCDPPAGTEDHGLSGTYENVRFLSNGTSANIYVKQDTNVIYCDQGEWKLGRGFLGFPAVPSVLQSDDEPAWMTSGQEQLSKIYGWSTVVLLSVFVVTIFGRSLYKTVVGCFRGVYEPEGRDAQIDFQNVAGISVYIPQFKLGALQFPILACDVDHVNNEWIGWNDEADPSFDNHNVIFDIPYEGLSRNKHESPGNIELDYTSPIFSLVKSWSRVQDNIDVQ